VGKKQARGGAPGTPKVAPQKPERKPRGGGHKKKRGTEGLVPRVTLEDRMKGNQTAGVWAYGKLTNHRH